MTQSFHPTGDTPIFVFGSNEAGLHGAGAASYAYKHMGARYGHAVGPCGNSYAIPTKDRKINSLTIKAIESYVDDFIDYANKHPELTFQITQIGCGLAGKKPEDIAPLFRWAPSNCWFDTAWKPWLGDDENYWGTHP